MEIGMESTSSAFPANLGKGFGLSSMKERGGALRGNVPIGCGPALELPIASSWPLKTSLQCR